MTKRAGGIPRENGLRLIQRWLDLQRRLKAEKPEQHRVVVDVGMESVRSPHPAELAAAIGGDVALASFDAMSRLDLARVSEAIEQSQRTDPPGGAGGLGIIEETIGWTAARFSELLNLGLFLINPLHGERRIQTFPGNRQHLETFRVRPEGHPDYAYLGSDLASISLFGVLPRTVLSEELGLQDEAIKDMGSLFRNPWEGMLRISVSSEQLDGTVGELVGRGVIGAEKKEALLTHLHRVAGKTKMPAETWLYTGFRQGEFVVPAIRLHVPGITGIPYPEHHSMLNLLQMHVLGEAGFKVAQHFGVLGTEDSLADLVVGHDGHTALFKFQLYLYFLRRHGDKEVAMQATRKLCVATIHAPQNGTVPRTTGDQVMHILDQGAEGDWGLCGVQPGAPTNALFADIALSRRVGVVSPIHWMVTQAEMTAGRRGFANGAAVQLFPADSPIKPDQIEIFPDTLDIESWIGMGDMRALDNHLLGWRSGGIPSDDLELGRVLDRLCVNQGFLLDLAQAFTVQRKHTHGLLGEHFPKTFGVEIPENAIVLASLRRATTYKINLLRSFLERSEIQLIAEKLGRPIFWLFGGLAHPADVPAMDSQQGLLELIYTINQRGGMLSADYYQGYSFETAKWLFPGLAWGGAWIGCTNPISPARSQGTEAFGPSYMKAALNGVHILGSHDGGAACLQDLPTVHIYGPRTFAAGVSAHNDLWGNESLGRNADILLTHGFVSELERVAGQIHQDLLRVEDGRAHQAPGLPAKIAAMFHIMSQWNGRVLMESYLSPTRKT